MRKHFRNLKQPSAICFDQLSEREGRTQRCTATTTTITTITVTTEILIILITALAIIIIAVGVMLVHSDWLNLMGMFDKNALIII